MSQHNIGNKEKREYIRMSVDAEVKCKVIGSGEDFTARCKNLSHTGLQLATTKKLNEGMEVDISLNIDSNLKRPPLKARFTVKRVSKTADGQYLVSGNLSDVR